jgi:hypothetical protein
LQIIQTVNEFRPFHCELLMKARRKNTKLLIGAKSLVD